jgi:hypothetical protein
VTTIKPIPNDPWAAFPVATGEDFGAFPETNDSGPLLGGAGATMGAAPEESFWSKAGARLKEAFFGHPDQAEAEAAGIATQPTTARMVETGMAGAAAMAAGAGAGQLAAHPLRAGLGMAGSMAGEKAGSLAGGAAEAVGAPRGTAAVLSGAGAVAGGVAGGVAPQRMVSRAVDALEVVSPARAAAARRLMGRGAAEAAEAAPAAAPLTSDGPRTLHVPEGMAKLPGKGAKAAAASGAEAQAAEVQAKVVALRQRGMSGAQITSSLRQLYGIKPSDGQKIVDMVLGAAKAQ